MFKKIMHRGMEQLAARRAHNPKVVSSSLTPATIKKQKLLKFLFFYSLNHFYIINNKKLRKNKNPRFYPGVSRSSIRNFFLGSLQSIALTVYNFGNAHVFHTDEILNICRNRICNVSSQQVSVKSS